MVNERPGVCSPSFWFSHTTILLLHFSYSYGLLVFYRKIVLPMYAVEAIWEIQHSSKTYYKHFVIVDLHLLFRFLESYQIRM